MWNALKILKAHPKGLNNTLLTTKYSLLCIHIDLSSKQLKLKDKKAWPVHIHCMSMRSFKF